MNQRVAKKILKNQGVLKYNTNQVAKAQGIATRLVASKAKKAAMPVALTKTKIKAQARAAASKAAANA